MKGKALLIGAASLAVMLGSGIGSAAESHLCAGSKCSASDTNTQTIDPLLTRSGAAPQYTQDLGVANIMSYEITAAGGFITAKITTRSPLPTKPEHVPPVCETSSSCRVSAPYAGAHVMVLFQTRNYEEEQADWSPPGYNADGYRWVFIYGLSNPSFFPPCALGSYDPTGRIADPVPIGVGQLYTFQDSALGASPPTASCTFSNGDKTVTIRIPYTYRFYDALGTESAIRIVDPGEKIMNTSAFSWMVNEIGVFGWTWYTDWLPSFSYKPGVIAGDPNPAVFAGPKCLTNFLAAEGVAVPVEGYETPGPCGVQNPIGTGYINTNYTLTAAG